MNKSRITLYALGAMLLLGIAYLAFIAHDFEYGSDMLQRPIFTLVTLLMFLGVIYLVATYSLVQLEQHTRPLLVWLFFVGIAARIILIPTDPILEDDFYRYLWDGGVTANGHNPYRFTPNDVILLPEKRGVPESLQELAVQSGTVAERINHPVLGTIYPPAAQAAFAFAHVLRPWSLISWKFVLLLADMGVLGLFLLMLRRLDLPLARAAIYWWNPLVLKEIYNSAHMDLLYVPFVLLAVFFALRHAPLRSALTLAAAIAVKIWPVIMAPLLIRNIQVPPKKIVVAIFSGTLILSILFFPVLPALDLGDRSGFLAYSDEWEMNDAVFMIFDKAIDTSLSWSAMTERQIDRAVRAAVTLALLLCIALLTRRPIQSGTDLTNRLALAAGIFFMISPTQFPWYYLWVLPFLVFSPRPSLLILTATLPMYYLKFYFVAKDNADFFHNRIVWIEYAPVLILAAWEIYQSRLPRPEPTHA